MHFQTFKKCTASRPGRPYCRVGIDPPMSETPRCDVIPLTCLLSGQAHASPISRPIDLAIQVLPHQETCKHSLANLTHTKKPRTCTKGLLCASPLPTPFSEIYPSMAGSRQVIRHCCRRWEMWISTDTNARMLLTREPARVCVCVYKVFHATVWATSALPTWPTLNQ